MAVSSVVASDLVPLKQRALFQGVGKRSLLSASTLLSAHFVPFPANLFFGAGSGLGGPVGGYISDRFGWRTAFLCTSFSIFKLLLQS